MIMIVPILRMQALGGRLSIDPKVFERYLSCHKEFSSLLPGVMVLDYVQSYFIRNRYGSLLGGEWHTFDEASSLNGRRGKLKRFWRDIVGHEQRVVVATVQNMSWKIPVGG
jgi:hypothetical protein